MPPISPISSTTIAKIKSEKAWLRKSRCMEFPGPLPTTWLVAMAIRACAICASLSISNFFLIEEAGNTVLPGFETVESRSVVQCLGRDSH
jgi:hypothetical protein